MCRKLMYLAFFVMVSSFVLTSVVKADLVGWWRLDEGTGTTVADFSGAGHNGFFAEGTPEWVEGKFGNALQFDGNNKVEIPDHPDFHLTDAVSIALWAKPEDTQPEYGKFFCKQKGSTEYPYAIQYNSSGGSIRGTVNASARFDTSSTPSFVGEWAHLCMTYDGSTAILYKDGEEVGRIEASGELQQNDLSLSIGGRLGSGQNFNGNPGDCWNVKVQTVGQVQNDRDQRAGNQKPVSEKPPQLVAVKRLLQHLGYAHKGEVHALVLHGLTAEQVDDAKHDEVANQNEHAPGKQGSDPGIPGYGLEHFSPAHLPSAGQPVVHGLHRFPVAGIQALRQQGLQDLLPAVPGRREVKRSREIDEKSPHQAGVCDTGGKHHQDPGRQQFPAGQQIPSAEYLAKDGDNDRQPEQNVKRRQREMPPSQGRSAAINVVERSDRADRHSQKKADQQRPQADLPSGVRGLNGGALTGRLH